MNKVKLQPKWSNLLITAVLISPLYYGTWIMTSNFVQATRAGRSLPQDSSWPLVICWFGVLLLMTGYIFYTQLVELLTTFTEEGVRKPNWRGTTFIPWSEVKRVVFLGHAVELQTQHTAIKLYPGTFGSKEQVLEEIYNRVPEELRQRHKDTFDSNNPFSN